MLLQLEAARITRAPGLQRDVGRQYVVARAHRRVAEHPIADGEMGRVRPDRAHLADSTGTWDHWEVQQVFPFAAEDLVGILAIPSFFEIKESDGVRMLSEKNRISFFRSPRCLQT
jgi:hypothetical protein